MQSDQVTRRDRARFDAVVGAGAFVSRHIGPSEGEIAAMLATLDLASLDELVDRVVPPRLRARRPLPLPAARSESEVLEHAARTANENDVIESYIGLGYHTTITPQVILRNVLEDPGWYTAYTPYQAEISQGRLEALLDFQTVVSDLTGLPIANASLLDESTAAAEAMTLALGQVPPKQRTTRRRFWVARDCHPQTIDVLRTRAEPLGIEVVTGDRDSSADAEATGAAVAGRAAIDETVFGVLVQCPSTSGELFDPRATIDRSRAAGALSIVASDLLALTLIESPGTLGADICVGSSQRFGVPLGFGGPHAAFFATRDELKRSVPGRMVGVSKDRAGRTALRLALQTREQHIRREKATSNICTAQVLLAVIAGLYAVYHGPDGLRRIARRIHRLASALAEGLREQGREVVHASFFDTIAVRVSSPDNQIALALQAGYNLRRIDDETIGIALGETTTADDIESLWFVFAKDSAALVPFDAVESRAADAIPDALARRTAFLDHEVFHAHHSETDFMRYLRRLRDRDIALNRSMIPLGSCTMKLNAATEMEPITWRSFAQIHPFAPRDQTRGYEILIRELEEQLIAITGFDAISLQPNAGSQGEYAGLLTIRAYHASRGEGQRDVCLIPSSAHGTNPASAAMAGMRVVPVPCDASGNVDVARLEELCAEHADRLAALMITYPSTHGVFEEALVEICDAVHAQGGQVYLDGANLNALVGLCFPGEIGPDVAHMNLHKTFCIPHGGGGPGVGPIGVRSHLAPFLPGHRALGTAAHGRSGAVAAAPWGSAGILPIPWIYIHLMGAEGLARATSVAILNANYIAKRLEGHYDVLYRGPNGMVAHECILDLRPLKKSADVEVSDVAKRLIDFGFHAPTMSWPVAGTLMVEPTESESQSELDRFCDAMIAIRQEVGAIETGRLDRADNPLKNAPHTAEDVTRDDWSHPYSREQAAYPLPWVRSDKYWPPVGLIDNLYGDRNFACSCPPLSAYTS